MVIAEEIQYITRQELLAVAAIIVSLSAVISGIIMTILKGTINMKILSLIQDAENRSAARESKSESRFENRFLKMENETEEIKSNYLERFQKQYEILSQLKENMIEIRTEIKKDLEYIKKKLEKGD